jgi:hypothetical protein
MTTTVNVIRRQAGIRCHSTALSTEFSNHNIIYNVQYRNGSETVIYLLLLRNYFY